MVAAIVGARRNSTEQGDQTGAAPQVSTHDPPPREYPATEWCVRQDFGYAAGCVWVLAVSAEDARRRGEPVFQTVFPMSPPTGPVEIFPRSEYSDRAGPRDFTAGVRLNRMTKGQTKQREHG